MSDGTPKIQILGFGYSKSEADNKFETKIEAEKLSQNIESNTKRITNLEARLSDDDFETDSTMAYRKSVPSGALPYAEIQKIGGATKHINLVPLDNINGAYPKDYANGTCEYNYVMPYEDNAYFTTIELEEGIYSYAIFGDFGGYPLDEPTGTFTMTEKGVKRIWIRSQKCYDDSDYLNCKNLKIMCWKGSTPPTEADFVPYGTFGYAKVTELRSDGKNLAQFDYWSASASGKSLTNPYGTTISSNEGYVVSVVQNNYSNTNITHYDNGYMFITLKEHLEADKEYNLSFDLTIKNNPLSAIEMNTLCNDTSNGKFTIANTNSKQRVNVKLTYRKNASYPNRKNIEIRCCGMSFDIGNVMITRADVTDTTYTPYGEIVDTFIIPEELRNFLDDKGYGRGVNNTHYNYIDFERKVFVQNVYKIIVNGTETIHAMNKGSNAYYEYAIEIDLRAPEDSRTVNLVSNHFIASSRAAVYAGDTENLISANNNYIRFTSSFDTKTKVGTYLKELYAKGKPLTIEYALEEPIETDISTYLTDDNFIKVQAGGSIVAVNENEKEEAVPFTVEYQKESTV